MLQLSAVSHSYTKKPAVIDATLSLDDGARMAIIGPSGCGKSTLLRIIAGLEPGHSGRISYRGRDITAVPTHLRGIGLIFQDHALFPHMTVAANIAYGLYGQPRDTSARRVSEMAELFGITGLLPRKPDELSGGERQRVALARSIAPSPGLLLFDEPFASLDRTLRDRFLYELPPLLQAAGVSSIYVTHDPAEACLIADTMVIMRAGRMLRQATPTALYRDPQTCFVASLLGMRDILPIGTAHGTLLEARPGATHLHIHPQAGVDAHNQPHSTITATVQSITLRPPWPQLSLCMVAGGPCFGYDWPFGDPPALGSQIRVQVRHDAIAWLHDDERDAE
jgi:ABC-type Fe3+/spermidine/putrescine transport system ATPase subunit